jgi:hypothetical protein
VCLGAKRLAGDGALVYDAAQSEGISRLGCCLSWSIDIAFIVASSRGLDGAQAEDRIGMDGTRMEGHLPARFEISA